MNVSNFNFENMPTNPFEGAKALFESTREWLGVVQALIFAVLCGGAALLLWWLFDMRTLLTLAFGIVVIPSAFVLLGFAATVSGLFAGTKGIQKLLVDVQAAVAKKKAAAA
jgi:hypothetical protein